MGDQRGDLAAPFLPTSYAGEKHLSSSFLAADVLSISLAIHHASSKVQASFSHPCCKPCRGTTTFLTDNVTKVGSQVCGCSRVLCWENGDFSSFDEYRDWPVPCSSYVWSEMNHSLHEINCFAFNSSLHDC